MTYSGVCGGGVMLLSLMLLLLLGDEKASTLRVYGRRGAPVRHEGDTVKIAAGKRPPLSQ